MKFGRLRVGEPVPLYVNPVCAGPSAAVEVHSDGDVTTIVSPGYRVS